LIGAQQHVHLVLRDQARGELLREWRAALVVDEHEIEGGAAHVRQPRALRERQLAELRMRAVDDLRGHLHRGLRGLPRRAGVAGQRKEDADLHTGGGG
jgi:hypothetical protein